MEELRKVAGLVVNDEIEINLEYISKKIKEAFENGYGEIRIIKQSELDKELYL